MLGRKRLSWAVSPSRLEKCRGDQQQSTEGPRSQKGQGHSSAQKVTFYAERVTRSKSSETNERTNTKGETTGQRHQRAQRAQRNEELGSYPRHYSITCFYLKNISLGSRIPFLSNILKYRGITSPPSSILFMCKSGVMISVLEPCFENA